MHLKPLTSLRFVFALMVFVSHLDFLKTSEIEVLKDLYVDIFTQGYIGVSFFFILSGFILTHVYRLQLDKDKKQPKKFYIARLARIYPLHVATFIIAIPLMFWGVAVDGKGVLLGISNLSLTHSYLPIKELYFSFNGPSWSISCELFFYLCFPLLLLWFKKLRSFKYLIAGILVILILTLPYVIDQRWHHGLFYINALFRLVDFILGMLLYDLYLKIKTWHTPATLLEILSIIIFIMFFIFKDQVTQTALYSVFYWIPMLFIILVFALQKGKISRLLSHKSAIWLGEISFGFYMFHHLVMRYFMLGNGKFELITDDYLIIFILLSTSIAAAAISHTFFEIPVNRWMRNRYHK